MQDRTLATPGRVTAEQVLADLRDQVMGQRPLLQEIADKASVDYAPTLAAMTEMLNGIEGRVTAVGTQLGAVVTRDEHARVTEAAVERGVALALREQDAERERKDAERQWLKAQRPPPRRLFGRRWLPQALRLPRKGRVAVAAFWIAAGFILFPFLGSVLPVGISSHMAAATMGTVSRWQAGSDILNAQDRTGWNRMVTQSRFTSKYENALMRCSRQANATQTVQNCTIPVAPQ